MLVIDVDGTLLNSRDELTRATNDAVRRVATAGVRVILASGRRYRQVVHLAEPLGIAAPLITASGALVKTPPDHRTLFRAEFAEGQVAAISQIVDRAGFDLLIYADTYAAGFDMYAPEPLRSSPLLEEFVGMNSADIRHHSHLSDDLPKDAFACFAVGSRSEMLDLAETLDADSPGALAIHVLRSPRYTGYMCEIAPVGVDKWTAVESLAKSWDISHDEICAIGDDVNDVGMIRSAGLGVAMGNAVDAVIAVADRVAPSNDEDGVVEVSRWILG